MYVVIHMYVSLYNAHKLYREVSKKTLLKISVGVNNAVVLSNDLTLTQCKLLKISVGVNSAMVLSNNLMLTECKVLLSIAQRA